MKPPSRYNLKTWLDDAGWELLEEVNLNTHYHQWYSRFLQQLNQKKPQLLEEFSEEAINCVELTFQSILNKIDKNFWGGAIFYARLRT